MREKLSSGAGPDAVGCRDKETVAAVMFHSGAEIPGFLSMWCPASAGLGIFEEDDTGAGWCQGSSIEIKNSKQLGIGRQLGIEPAGAKKIQRERCLW